MAPQAPYTVYLLALLAAFSVAACNSGGSSGGGAAAALPADPLEADWVVVARGRTAVFDPVANDYSGMSLTSIDIPANGTLRFVGEALEYTPTPGYVGTEILAYDAVHSSGETFSSTVTIETTAITSRFETEPNDSQASANTINRGEAAIGELEDSDTDYWEFSATAGEWLTIELFAARWSQALWDGDCRQPYIAILDTDGNLVRQHGFVWNWGGHDLDIPALYIPETGDYAIRLVVGDAIGQTGGSTSGPNPYSLLLTTAPVANVQEELEAPGTQGANEFLRTAELVEPGFIHGQHVEGGDYDLYKFEITGETQVSLELTSFRSGLAGGEDSYWDPALILYDRDGNALLYNEDSYFWDPALSFHLNIPGTYYFEVTGFFEDRTADYLVRFKTFTAGVDTESEGNGTATSADDIAYGDVIAGSNDGDLDLFRFTATAGDAVRAWFYNGENHGVLDPALTVRFLDIDGATELRASAPSDVSGHLRAARTLIPADGDYFVEITGGSAATPSIYSLRLERFSTATWETEPNNTTVLAEPFSAEGRVAGTMSDSTDVDVYQFDAVVDEWVSFAIHADRGAFSDGVTALSANGSTFAPGLEIHDELLTYSLVVYTTSNPTPCLSGESVTNPTATLEAAFVAPATGTYYVSVFSPFTLTADDEAHYWVEKR